MMMMLSLLLLLLLPLLVAVMVMVLFDKGMDGQMKPKKKEEQKGKKAYTLNIYKKSV